MRYRYLISNSRMVGAFVLVCGPANPADDAAAICKAAVSAYED